MEDVGLETLPQGHFPAAAPSSSGSRLCLSVGEEGTPATLVDPSGASRRRPAQSRCRTLSPLLQNVRPSPLGARGAAAPADEEISRLSERVAPTCWLSPCSLLLLQSFRGLDLKLRPGRAGAGGATRDTRVRGGRPSLPSSAGQSCSSPGVQQEIESTTSRRRRWGGLQRFSPAEMLKETNHRLGDSTEVSRGQRVLGTRQGLCCERPPRRRDVRVLIQCLELSGSKLSSGELP